MPTLVVKPYGTNPKTGQEYYGLFIREHDCAAEVSWKPLAYFDADTAQEIHKAGTPEFWNMESVLEK